MKGFLFVILFTLLTAVCWGIYGPVLQTGQFALRESIFDAPGRWRAFICVGLAYFVIAILVPMIWLQLNGEKGNWTSSGFLWSFIAGIGGALGALGIVLAFTFGGKPIYVMPLVFGVAPVVNTFTTMYMNKTLKEVGPMFLAGLILVIMGAVTVLFFKPAEPKVTFSDVKVNDEKAPLKERKISLMFTKTEADGKKETLPITDMTLPEMVEKKGVYLEAAKAYLAKTGGAMSTFNWIMVVASIALTGISWGVYGPTLHKGQFAMNGSRLRPFLCVGLAYLVIAVVVPFALLGWLEPNGAFNFNGTSWSLGGGAVGAIGALGVIMAFNFGGKPIFVMPLIFGLAPVINSFVELFRSNLLGEIGPLFYAGLLLVIGGAVTVLLFAPRAKPHGPAPTSVPAKA